MAEDDHRQPRNLQDILRLAVENQVARDGGADSSAADTPSQASASEASVERQQWLSQTLSSFETDPINEMKKGIGFISDALATIERNNGVIDTQTQDDLLYTLETLIDYVGSIDYANDFNKLGGTAMLLPLLKMDSNDIKMKTCDLFAEIVQNNEKAQQFAVETNILELLTQLLDKSDSEHVRIKALYAISCLIRENQQAARKFDSDLDGMSVLLRAMQHETETYKLRIKASFLITALCTNDEQIKETLFKMGFVEQLVALLHTEHNASHEYLLSALNALIIEHEGSRKECQRTELGLENLLQQKLKALAENPQFAEERYFATQILNKCFPNSEQMEEER